MPETFHSKENISSKLECLGFERVMKMKCKSSSMQEVNKIKKKKIPK